jgi:hypothetical protein
MAATLVYDLVDPLELIQYVREYDNEVLRQEAQFVLDQWLPNITTEDLEFKIRKGALNDVDSAEYRAWDTPAPFTGRPGVTRIQGSLGPISKQIPLGEEEYLRTRSLDRGNNDPLIEQIFEDAENMIRSVQIRVERARGDVIDDGIVTITENGLTLVADFGRHPDMSPTAAVVWTNPAAEILTELLGLQEDYNEHNGVDPAVLLVPRARVGNFALNAEMLDYASANGTTPNRVNRATIDQIFATEGLPPIQVYDGSFRVDGESTRVLNANKVYFMPPPGEAFGNTFYGTTAEALKLRAKGYIDRDVAPGLVAVVTETDDPVQTYTKGAGVALPATPNPDLVMDITVLGF